jgi:hypothetical protein
MVNMRDKQLTEFQTALMDAVDASIEAAMAHAMHLLDSSKASLEAQRYTEAKAAFRALVERAVDSDKPRKYADDGIWVRIDD